MLSSLDDGGMRTPVSVERRSSVRDLWFRTQRDTCKNCVNRVASRPMCYLFLCTKSS